MDKEASFSPGDEKLHKLYFPYGVDNDGHINDDELALHDSMIEYMNDNVTHDDNMAEYAR